MIDRPLTPRCRRCIPCRPAKKLVGPFNGARVPMCNACALEVSRTAKVVTVIEALWTDRERLACEP